MWRGHYAQRGGEGRGRVGAGFTGSAWRRLEGAEDTAESSPSFARIDRLKPAPAKKSELRWGLTGATQRIVSLPTRRQFPVRAGTKTKAWSDAVSSSQRGSVPSSFRRKREPIGASVDGVQSQGSSVRSPVATWMVVTDWRPMPVTNSFCPSGENASPLGISIPGKERTVAAPARSWNKVNLLRWMMAAS